MLTDALEIPGTDLHAILAVLHDDLTEVIAALLGLSITLVLTGPADSASTVISTLRDGTPAAASADRDFPGRKDRPGNRDAAGLRARSRRGRAGPPCRPAPSDRHQTARHAPNPPPPPPNDSALGSDPGVELR
ncbi:hypothetical protein GCM10009818_11250 [Nakamurella flavida]